MWAAPHQGWWDPFVAAAVLTGAGRTPSLVMDQENLGDFAFLRRVGVFGTGELRQGLDHLAAGHALIVFPERDLLPVGPLRQLEDGAAWLAQHGPVPLLAAAVRVAARGHQASEAYVDLVPVPLPDGSSRADVSVATAALARVLGAALAAVDAELAPPTRASRCPDSPRSCTGGEAWTRGCSGGPRASGVESRRPGLPRGRRPRACSPTPSSSRAWRLHPPTACRPCPCSSRPATRPETSFVRSPPGWTSRFSRCSFSTTARPTALPTWFTNWPRASLGCASSRAGRCPRAGWASPGRATSSPKRPAVSCSSSATPTSSCTRSRLGHCRRGAAAVGRPLLESSRSSGPGASASACSCRSSTRCCWLSCPTGCSRCRSPRRPPPTDSCSRSGARPTTRSAGTPRCATPSSRTCGWPTRPARPGCGSGSPSGARTSRRGCTTATPRLSVGSASPSERRTGSPGCC